MKLAAAVQRRREGATRMWKDRANRFSAVAAKELKAHPLSSHRRAFDVDAAEAE